MIPSQSFEIDTWKIRSNVKLANPMSNISADIDMILGFIFWEIMNDLSITLSSELPYLFDTRFGMILNQNFLFQVDAYFSPVQALFCLNFIKSILNQ